MIHNSHTSFIHTIRERCRVCYTCVRECPAKAIRIADGQADVLTDRCISCGNCVRVCSQRAKQVVRTTDRVRELLAGPQKVAACLAPSFPAEFSEMDYRILVGMIRALGFAWVTEVAFGADLVARRYRELLSNNREKKRYISTTCPAVISFVEKYHPHLLPCLSPIVSPMVAMARVLHRLHGSDINIVFIGPCIAKKYESMSLHLPGEVQAAITFFELREMFQHANILPSGAPPSDFDPPRAGLGALFPISRGLLQAADISENLMTGEIVATDGRTNFVEAIKEFESGSLEAELLEVLACNGCIMGAGMSTQDPMFRRRSHVSRYIRQRLKHFDPDRLNQELHAYDDLNLDRGFTANDQRIGVPFEEEINHIMNRMGKLKPEDELNCGACGYDTCREHAIAIFKGLAESEMCLPNTIEQLRQTIGKLASTQEALMQSEKLASMGQLAAGIAHEVNNPLGVVLMYSHLLLEQCEQHPELAEDLKMIAEQADRCKKIVAGLLHFARQNKVIHQPVNICELLNKIIKITKVPDGIEVQTNFQLEDPVAEIDPDQITQVITNLVNNAVAAMPRGGRLTLHASQEDSKVRITVEDTGVGIPEQNLSRLFQPFFSTKNPGEGTGLGLSVTYGIVKMHCGDIRVKSNADPARGPTGTAFIVTLPRKGAAG